MKRKAAIAWLVFLALAAAYGLAPAQITGGHPAHRLGLTFSPLAQFGSSYGPTTDETQAVYDAELAAMKKYCGGTTQENPPCLIRATIHWTPQTQAGPNFSGKYDQFVSDAWADGILWLPEIHTSKTTGGTINPLTCDGISGSNPGCGSGNFEAAVESIAERYGPNGTYTLAHPGFPGITRYEVWNEPNTPTGHDAANSGAMPAVQMDEILHAESTALQAGASAKNWLGKLQIACCAFGNLGSSAYPYDITYLQSMIAASPPGGNTVWADISPTGAKPGVITTHQYQEGNPATCNASGSTGPKCFTYETNLHNYLVAQGQCATSSTCVGLGNTEGGFSGIDDNNVGTVNGGPTNCTAEPSDVTSEANQAAWDSWDINWAQNTGVGDDIEFIAWYRIIDGAPDPARGGCTTIGGASRWQSGLAPVNSDGTLKPWGTDYKAIITAAQGTAPTSGCSTYNVVTDGADSTGVSNSTSAFNTAITAASGQGSQTTPCVVTVPTGTYRLNGVNLASNVTVKFGSGTVLEDTSGGTGSLITIGGGIANVTLEPASTTGGWVIDLDPTVTGGSNTVCGICVNDVNGFTINGVTTIENQSTTAGTSPDSADSAIQVTRLATGQGPTNGTIENITGIAAPFSGGPLQVNGGDHLTISNVTSTGGDALNMKLTTGFGLLGVSNLTVTNLTCYRGDSALHVVANGNPMTDIVVSGVLATSCSYGVKWADASTGSSVSGIDVISGTSAQNGTGLGAWSVGASKACVSDIGNVPFSNETCSGF